MKIKYIYSTLGLIFFAVFIIYIGSRTITNCDSRWTIHQAMSVIREGNLNLDEYRDTIDLSDYCIIIDNGHIYSNYRATAVFAVPFVFIADKTLGFLSHTFPGFQNFIKACIKSQGRSCPDNINVLTLSPVIQLLISSFIVSITAVFIYLIAQIFLDRQNSLVVTFIFSFCTSSWSTVSRGLWQHGPSMLMLSIALYLILSAKKKPWLIQFAGVPLLFSFAIRPSNIISLILLSVYVLIEHRKFFLPYLAWMVPVVMPFIIFTLSEYDTYLLNRYFIKTPLLHIQQNFFLKKSFVEILAANIISPSRGLFIYSPVLLFSVVGMFLKKRMLQLNKVNYFLCIIILSHWVVISCIDGWTAGCSFGPRYFSDVIPYLIYFLIFSVAEIASLKGPKKVFLAGIFFIFVVFSMFVHYRGATDISVYAWNTEPVNVDKYPERVWDWHDIQFLRDGGF